MNAFLSRWNTSLINLNIPTRLLIFGKSGARIRSDKCVARSSAVGMCKTTTRNICMSSRFHVSFVYTVSLKTGDVMGAGTDSNVYIRMVGVQGSTNEIRLKTEKHDLEQGQLDHFTLPFEDVGPLKKIIIRHDNTGFAPGWFLEWVKIRDGRGKKYHFECNEWLVKGEQYDNIKLLKESSYLSEHDGKSFENEVDEPKAGINEGMTLEDLAKSNEIDKEVLHDLKVLDQLSGQSATTDENNVLSAIFDEPEEKTGRVEEKMEGLEILNDDEKLVELGGNEEELEELTDDYTKLEDLIGKEEKLEDFTDDEKKLELGGIVEEVEELTDDYAKLEDLVCKEEKLEDITDDEKKLEELGGNADILGELNGEEEKLEEPNKSGRHATSLSPAVRNIIDTYGIDMVNISPTGPESRILKGDVLLYVLKENLTKKVFIENNVDTDDRKLSFVSEVQNISELPSDRELHESDAQHVPIVTEQYVDHTLTGVNKFLSEELKHNKYEVPHIYMSSACDADKLNTFTTIADQSSSSETRNIILTRVMCQSLVDTHGIVLNNEDINILLTHNGNSIILENCGDANVDNVYYQYKHSNDAVDTVQIPRYGLNIVDIDGITQVSSILRVGQVIALNVSGTKLDIDLSGKVSKYVTLSISCDGRVIPEATCASLLSNCKKYLSDPNLLGL